MEEERVRLSDKLSANESHGGGDDSVIDFSAMSFEERPIWTSLFESFRAVLFPPALPPLELTSSPIPTPDRLAVNTNPWAIGTATVVNGAILGAFVLLGLGAGVNRFPKSPSGGNIRLSDLTIFAPLTKRPAHGGGGGGSNALIDPRIGRLPQREEMPITPPQVPLIENPKLAVDAAIAVPLEIKLPDNPSLPNIGVYRSINVSLDSSGPGSKTGIGTGSKGGIGAGEGPGYGSGSDHGAGGDVFRAGFDGVSNPIPVVAPDAEFSDEARRNKYQGICIIAVIVDAHGYPRNPRVIRSLGMGLDEKARESVQKYRFKPAMKDGRPVAAMINVEVDFRLY